MMPWRSTGERYSPLPPFSCHPIGFVRSKLATLPEATAPDDAADFDAAAALTALFDDDVLVA
jgi:hypothetical protein